jgi:hypothetical protein
MRVRFGKKAGRTARKDKVFATPALAEAAAKKAVLARQADGYSEVSSGWQNFWLPPPAAAAKPPTKVPRMEMSPTKDIRC